MAADSGSRSWKTNIFWTKDQDNPNERIIKLHMPGVIFDPRFNVKTPMVRKPVHMLKPRCASSKKKTFHSVEKRQVLKETNSPANLSNGFPGSAAFSQYGSGDNKFVKVHKRSKEQLSLKELNPQDKKRVANLVKELAKVGEERVNAEERLQTERKAFEERLVILQEEYDAVLKEKQYLKKRFLELQALLVKYQVNGRMSSPPKPVQAREDKENQKMLVAFSSPKQKDVSPPGSVLTQFPGNTRPANTGSATEDTTSVKFTKQPHLRSQAISCERSDSLVPLNNTMQSGSTHEKTTRKTNSGHCPHETEEPIRDKVNSSGDRFESAGTSTEAGYAVALQCQSQEIAQNSHFGDEVHLHAINPQEETPNSVSSRDRPRSDTTSQPAVHPGPAAMVSQIPLQTKAVIPGVGDDVDNGQLPPRKNEDRSFSEMSEISGHFSAELDAVYRLYCREYELQLQLQQQQIELQKQQLQLQQQLQQVEALQQKQEQQRQQDEGQFKEQPQHFKPEKKQQEQRQGQEAVGQTSPMQGVTRVSVKSDETIKQGVIEKMPSSTLVPGLSSKLLQVSPARSLVTTLEGSSSVPSNSRPDMVPVPVPVEGKSSEGPGLPPSEIQGMEQQRGIGVPAVINRGVSAPLSVRPAWSDVQHQLHSRRQKDYAFRNTVPIDHDSNCSGLLPDFSKYIAYEHRPTASRPSDEKESNDMNCSGALPSRYSLYSHSRNASSRGSGRESSRLIYPSSNYAASSEGNVSKTELEPYVLFYKGLTARNHSPISDFPMAESMERHCVAKYQHSADESASHILSEDGLRSFKDCRVEESGERVPLDSSAYPLSLLDIVDGLENIAGEQGECCRSQELTEGLDTTDSGYSQDTNRGRGPLTPEIVNTDEEEAAVLEDIFFRPLGRL